MNLLLIGQSLEDHILSGDSEEIKPGGIFYSVWGLKNFISDDDKITLCTAVDKSNIELFYPAYEGLDKKYFQEDPDLPKVYLDLSGEKERGECYSKISKNLSIEIENLNLYDGILINMITGFDITKDQLSDLRKLYKGKIYFDVHTLSRGIDNEGQREFRTIPGFDEWARNIDILQVNESEFYNLYETKEKNEILNRIFSDGVKILVITKGDKGAGIFYKLKNEIVSEFYSAIKTETKNKVGCGDVFGAVFFYSYISSGNPQKALQIANIAAGFVSSYDKLDKYKKLKEDVYTRIG